MNLFLAIIYTYTYFNRFGAVMKMLARWSKFSMLSRSNIKSASLYSISSLNCTNFCYSNGISAVPSIKFANVVVFATFYYFYKPLPNFLIFFLLYNSNATVDVLMLWAASESYVLLISIILPVLGLPLLNYIWSELYMLNYFAYTFYDQWIHQILRSVHVLQ